MRTVREVRATPHLGGGRIDLRWVNPPASDFDPAAPFSGIRILRNERTFARDENDGDLVYQGAVVASFSDAGLAPRTTYYYTVFALDQPPLPAPPRFYGDGATTASAFATGTYDIAERLYRLLPSVHQRLDVPLQATEITALPDAVRAAFLALPPAMRTRGQLRRFFQAAAAPLDAARSLAEGLRQLRDLERMRPEFLPSAAQWIGWSLDRTLPIHAQRNEIRSAPALYRDVGTVPNLRAIVTRYTGWYAQVVEFDQHIARSNAPPQLNVFGIVETAGGFRATDDAAPLLGFGAGNDHATGSGAVAAELVSALEPFALRPNMELVLTADERVPVAVRFEPGDFAAIGAATAREIAAVLNRTLTEATASVVTGRVHVRSNTVGTSSTLQIEQYTASLVTLESAPSGRLSTFLEPAAGGARTRLFYETAEPLAAISRRAAEQAATHARPPTGAIPGVPLDKGAPVDESEVLIASQPVGRVRYKTYRDDAWGSSLPLPIGRDVPHGDPTALAVAGTVFVAWIENPGTPLSAIRFMTGPPRAPTPARLLGVRNGPFAIADGATILFRRSAREAFGFAFLATDFAIPGRGTIAEIVLALNTRVPFIIASATGGGTLVIATLATGEDEHLAIDLPRSSAAAALGFGADNALAAGSFGEEIDWGAPADVTPAPAGTTASPHRYADLHAVLDAAGGVRLFWAAHTGSSWTIFTARWNGASWSAADLRASGGTGNREPFAVLDATNRIWLFWSQRQGTGGLSDVWTLRRQVFDPGPSTWGPDTAVTTAPAVDRAPAAVRAGSGDLRVFFQSTRDGGPQIWTLTVTPATGTLSPLTRVTAGPPAGEAPAPILGPTGDLRVFYRSDRGVPLSRVSVRPFTAPANRTIPGPSTPAPLLPDLPRSYRAPDTGTLRRFCGSTTAALQDSARIGAQRRVDNLLSYTPQKPRGELFGEPLADDDVYTRGTLGLVLSQELSASPMSAAMFERLRPVLDRFLPINMRAVVILAPPVFTELVYRPVDIGERYTDDYPDVDYLGPVDESYRALLPGWSILRTNTLGDISADPADLTTLARRVFFTPPE